MRYRPLDVLIILVLLVIVLLALRGGGYLGMATPDAAAQSGPAMCDVTASDPVFRRCIALQASAALELRAEVVQLNNRIAQLEARPVNGTLSRDAIWQMAREAAYFEMQRYGVLR